MLCSMVACWYCGVDVPERFAQRSQGTCPTCEYLSLQDACSRLHIDISTLYRLMTAGSLRRFKVAGRSLVRRMDVEALFRQG
jgi:excisionase family DNA binding protein